MLLWLRPPDTRVYPSHRWFFCYFTPVTSNPILQSQAGTDGICAYSAIRESLRRPSEDEREKGEPPEHGGVLPHQGDMSSSASNANFNESVSPIAS